MHFAVEINFVYPIAKDRPVKIIAFQHGDATGHVQYGYCPDCNCWHTANDSDMASKVLISTLIRTLCGGGSCEPASLDTLAFFKENCPEDFTVRTAKAFEEAILRQVDEQGARLVDGAKEGGE